MKSSDSIDRSNHAASKRNGTTLGSFHFDDGMIRADAEKEAD